ncbi:MAG: tetratricopeptide repeat protein [Bacteroidales bacterium]|nr:tetratricopeptide repeat protein [Bacteroidales bacterium]MBR4817848.1 tetratricopeptide repeat protein [Bacteroidales bacterium]MBR5054030.1 tetratricopeptide repeat protein [Bacteroidales bacterium]
MKRIAVIIYTIVFLSLSAPALLSQDRTSRLRDTAESLLVDAVQAYDNGATKAAMDRFSAILETFPDNDAAHYYMGLCHARLGDAGKAVDEIREAVRLAPDNYWYRDRLAALYAMTGQDDEAVAAYEALLADFPRKTEIHYSLVNLYAMQNRLDKVLETLDEIERVMGRDETTALARYDILMHQDKAAEAFAVLEEFNEDFPSPQVLSMMGDAKAAADSDSLAMAYYDQALALDSGYAPALIGKSEVYRMNRSFDGFFNTLEDFVSSPSIHPQAKSQYLSNLTQYLDARFFQNFQPQLDSLFDNGVKAHPADSSMLMTAGTYFFRSDRRDRGVELFKTNSDLYPGDFNARAMYIQSLSYSDDWDTLLKASEEAYAAFPDEPAFLNMRVMAYYNKGDMQSVISESERMAAAFKDNPDVVVQALSMIGDTYHQLDNEKEAFAAYERALKIDPEYAPVLNNYAYYLCLNGKKLKKAAEMSRITVEQEPDNATYLDTYGWILHLLKKSQEAKSYFKHAMLYGGKDSATILDHYAEVLYSLGEYDLAKVYWDDAVKKDTDNEIPDLVTRIGERMKAIGR